MSDRRIYKIDYQALDEVAIGKGVNPLELLGLERRARSVLGEHDLASLDTLRAMVSDDPFALIGVEGLGLDTARRVYFGLKEFSERPMSAHLRTIAKLAEPKLVSPKPKREPRLLGLAQPFYEKGGGELDDKVTMRNLTDWQYIYRSRESDWEFGQGWRERFRSWSVVTIYNEDGNEVKVKDPFEEERKTEHLVPDRLIAYMSERDQYDRGVIEGAFRAARYAGIENVGAIRSTPDQELDKLGVRRRFFFRVGLGVIVDGKVVPAEQYMIPPRSSV